MTEIVNEEAMISPELAHATSHVVDASKPKRCEHERGRPAFGP